MNVSGHHRKKKILGVGAVGTLSNILLTVLKLVAGIVGNSSALIADAANSLSDLITDIVLFVLYEAAAQDIVATFDNRHSTLCTRTAFLPPLRQVS